MKSPATPPATAPAKPKSPTEVDHSIGTRIATLRLAKGLSQTQLGQSIGVTFQQVQKYEKGANRIGAGRLQSIAECLGVPISTLFEASGPDAAGDASMPSAEQLPFMRVAGAVDLLQAYASIGDANMRRDILAIVRTAARMAVPKD